MASPSPHLAKWIPMAMRIIEWLLTEHFQIAIMRQLFIILAGSPFPLCSETHPMTSQYDRIQPRNRVQGYGKYP